MENLVVGAPTIPSIATQNYSQGDVRSGKRIASRVWDCGEGTGTTQSGTVSVGFGELHVGTGRDNAQASLGNGGLEVHSFGGKVQ